jgi:hypothetical protein
MPLELLGHIARLAAATALVFLTGCESLKPSKTSTNKAKELSWVYF